MKKLWCLILALALSTQGFGFEGGSTGGGYAVYCTDPLTRNATVRLLDYYEAELLLPDLSLDLGTGASETDLALNAVSRLERVDAARAKDYEAKVRGFLSETLFVSVNIPDINDYGFAPLGDNCSLKQMAAQNLVPIPEGKKYTVSKDVWNKLSVMDRAGLILHEVIYEEALAQGHKDSRNSRYFNALLSSKEFEKLTDQQYLARLQAVGLPEKLGGNTRPSLGFPDVTAVAEVGKAFHFPLAGYVLSQAKHPLTFTKLSGPGWITITPDGVMTGTPAASEVGKSTFDIRASDGTRSVTGKVTVTVVSNSHVVLPVATQWRTYYYDLVKTWPFEQVCQQKRATKVSGPDWLAVKGTNIEGTPTSADLGTFVLVLDLEQTCDRIVQEEVGGKTISRTVAETQSLRARYEGHVSKTVGAVGTEVGKGEWDEAGYVKLSSGHCQATLVGPRVVVTAGHCANTKVKGSFEYAGVSYPVEFTRHPDWPKDRDKLDVSVGLLEYEVPNSAPVNIGGKASVGDKVQVLAYDTLSAAGMKLFSYTHKLTDVRGEHWLTSDHSGLQSITFGNSGAPLIVGKRNLTLAGIVTMSNMGVPETVYSLKLGSPKIQAFLQDFAAAHKVEICGVTTTCSH